MATRIESGQMQVRSVGNAPIVQVQQQQIDYVGPRAEAQAAGTMAQILDRMSASAFADAATMRKEEGLQFVASNPISQEQVQLAKDGVVTGLGLGGVGTQNIFEQAVAKARSFELSGHFEMEGRNELAKLLADVEAGKASSEQVLQEQGRYARAKEDRSDGDVQQMLNALVGTHDPSDEFLCSAS